MVFNWFRRQFGTSETPQVEEEQLQEQQEEESALTQSTQEQPAVNEDYLSWAKAAYQNMKRQQQEEEGTPTAEEPSASTTQVEVDQTDVSPTEATEAPAIPEPTEASQTSQAVEEPVLPKDTEPSTETTTTTPETVAEEAGEAGEIAIPESPPVASAPVEAQGTAPSVESVSQPPVAEVQQPEAVEASAAVSELSDAEVQQPEPKTVAPIVEEPVAIEAPQTPAAPIPIWARQSEAERQARLERLKETAIELPEPEPVTAPVQPVAPAATTVEQEGVPGLAFDEGFLWSAEVLAAQGRRPEEVSIEEISWLKRLRQGLDKTRRSLINQLKAIVGQGPLNQDAVMEIEALLLQADVGVEATDYIISTLQKKLREEVLPPEQAIAYLKQILRDLLEQPYQDGYSPTFAPQKDTLNIWLITGVNGAGKTTTIGKIAHLAQKSDYHCLIGAADTFRAAAVEQVKIWGQRSGTEVIANPAKNADPAAVVFDAIAAAQARNIELLLVDTAGRLQNKKNLMEELAKIRRIIDKKAPNATVESLLVLDATLGQNGLRQAEVFSQAAKLSGVVLTKLDSTAKGGVALAVVRELGLPIRFIGAGEGIEDLRPFSSYEFIEALLSG